MRGDMTVQKSNMVSGILGGKRVLIEGDMISVISKGGVAKRDSERSFRVSVNGDVLYAIAPNAVAGDTISVNLVMMAEYNQEGNRLYRLIPTPVGRAAHAIIKTRG